MGKVAFAFGFLVFVLFPGELFSQTPELVVQTGHVGSVAAIAFSPDSKLLVSAGSDAALILWNAGAGRQLRTLKGHTAQITSAAFSNDGSLLVSGSVDGTVRIWETASGKSLRMLKGTASIIDSVALSPDGSVLAAGGNDNCIKIWSTATGTELFTLSGHTSDVSSLAFSPDGRILASGSHDHGVRLWEVSTGRLIKLLSGHPVAVMAVAYSKDGRYIASGGGGYAGNAVVIVWDAKTGNQKYKFTTTDEWVSSLAFSPDGDFLLGGTNTRGRALRRWDLATGVDLGTVPTKSSAVFAVAFSPNSKLFAYGGDDKVTLLDPSTWKELRILEGRVREIDFVALSSDGKTLAAGGSDTAWLWDLPNAKVSRRIVFDDVLTAMAFSPKGDLLAGANRGGVELRNAAGEKLLTLTGFTAPVRCVAFSPDGSLLAVGSGDGIVKIWDLGEGKELRTLTGHLDFVRAIAFSPDGRTVLTGSADTTIKNWDIGTGKEIGTMLGHTNWVEALAVASDGRTFLSGSGDETVRLWNGSTGETEKILQGHTNRVTTVAFGPDGKSALSGGDDDTLRLWDLAAGKETQKLEARSGGVTAAAFSPDGNLVVAGTKDGTIKIWNRETGKEILSFLGFKDGEWIAITPDGYFEASPEGAKYLNVRIGTEAYSIDQFYSSFYRPELVRLALEGNEPPNGETLTTVLTTKAAPTVNILSPLPGDVVEGDRVALELALTDNGGGIGDVSVYLNNSQIANDTRGLTVISDESSRGKRLSFTLPLAAGENAIKVIAANKDGSMESIPALVEITSNAALSKPNLYALVVGINKYRNESIALSYAVSDAQAVAAALKDVSAPLFESTDIELLSTPENTTKEAIIKAFEDLKPKVKPADLFVFYDASHGVVDVEDTQYFLLTSNVLFLSSRRIAADALSQKDLANLIGGIPAEKKLVILDTCDAGKGGKEIAIALFQQTRGLGESTAIKLLKRATGAAVFSGSSDTEQALEGYRGHGLFTYVLLEGLRGKADTRNDGYITILGLADYVEEEVVRLSEETFKRQQTPTIQTSTNFPIGKVQ